MKSLYFIINYISHSIIKFICMNVFSFWYVYYDSIFVEPQLQPKKIVLEGFLHEIKQPVNWPYGVKQPSITRCYSILQKFIQNPQNWQKCNCSENEIFQIQSKINKIYTLLMIEKQYAIEFWKSSKRRLQSSICHFFIFFQNLIKAIIMDDNMSIQECWKRDILCTTPSNLEKLSYQVMQNMEKLYLFMIRPEFTSEKALTIKFFEYYQWLVQNLTSIQRKNIGKVPKLLEYINLSNPIQISKRKIVEQQVTKVKIRKKSNTIGSKPQRKRKSQDFTRQHYEDIFKEFNGYIYRSKRFNKSCDSKICQKNEKSDNNKSEYQIPTLFKFKPQIHRNFSVYISKKKDTVSTQECIPSLSYLVPSNLRPQSIDQSNMKRTQSLQFQTTQKKLLTKSITLSVQNDISTNKPMIRGQKRMKKIQKKIDYLISGKDEEIERDQYKLQVENVEMYLTKSEALQQRKQGQHVKNFSLSNGSRKNRKISEQQQISIIQNKMDILLKKI